MAWHTIIWATNSFNSRLHKPSNHSWRHTMKTVRWWPSKLVGWQVAKWEAIWDLWVAIWMATWPWVEIWDLWMAILAVETSIKASLTPSSKISWCHLISPQSTLKSTSSMPWRLFQTSSCQTQEVAWANKNSLCSVATRHNKCSRAAIVDLNNNSNTWTTITSVHQAKGNFEIRSSGKDI